MTRCGILLELMGQGGMIMGVGQGEDRDALMTLYWKIPLNFVFKRSFCGTENICSDKTKLPRYFFCQEGRNKDSPRDKGPGAPLMRILAIEGEDIIRELYLSYS